MSQTVPLSPVQKLRVGIQKFGTFLSGMVMPNIPAFIAWGLITALFIEDGWLPVPELGGFGVNAEGEPNAGVVGPMVTYLLPLLIAYQGGRMVYETRGGVVGAIATMGVVAGVDIPMFIGAMIMGPLSAWAMKRLDALWHGRIKAGFEMLVNNFSAGILGMLLALLGFYGVGPAVKWLTGVLGAGIEWLIEAQLLPLVSILIEPAKILFLNNAINHGLLTPLATAQAAETGKSVLFLIETNPGPGLGVLLAYTVFGVGMSRASAPGAVVIHLFGGIHEIYFPYVLAKPSLILAVIAGGASGVATNMMLGTGLVSAASPGSILAIMPLTAQGSQFGVLLSVLVAATVSFLVASPILIASRRRDAAGGGDLSAAIAAAEANKGSSSAHMSALASGAVGDEGEARRPVREVVFACDAGMGSSAMGAGVLRRKFQQAGLEGITVTNVAVANLDDAPDLVVTHQDLTDRARQKAPGAIHVSVTNFMASPRYDEVVELVREQRRKADGPAEPEADAERPGPGPAAGADAVREREAEVLGLEQIRAHGRAASRDEAMAQAAEILVAAGAVTGDYLEAMRERERSVTTFMGNGLAIPHGTNEAKESIRASALSFVRYDEPVDWDGEEVRFVVGVAGKEGGHLALLQKVAILFSDEAKVQRLLEAPDERALYEILQSVNE
ncbi:MAG: PTS mannitol transporter subunit IICBA [Pseudoclavibacter sp.]|nr:PTS mannitol transporter subunit IICBA [Pseudoclavibacter sp.]